MSGRGFHEWGFLTCTCCYQPVEHLPGGELSCGCVGAARCPTCKRCRVHCDCRRTATRLGTRAAARP